MKDINHLLTYLILLNFSASVPAKAECPGVSLLPDILLSRVWLNGNQVTDNKALLVPGSRLLKSAVILNEKVYAAALHLLHPVDNEGLKNLTLMLLPPLKDGVCEYEVKDPKGIEKLGTFTLLEPTLLENL